MGMGKSNFVMLLLGAMFGWSIGLHLKVEATASSSDVDAKLKLLNKPAVKTIKVFFFFFLIIFLIFCLKSLLKC